MKYIIFFLILFSSNVFSQKDYFKYIELTLYNSEGKKIEDATIVVDGKIVPFDSPRQVYYLADSIHENFIVEVTSDAYEAVSISQKNLHNLGNQFTPSYFRSFIYLKRPTEKYYYPGDDYRTKIPYQPHPNQLLVILNTKGRPIHDSLRLQLESNIHQMGLKIKTYFPEPPSNIEEQWMLKGIVGLEKIVIIEKEDGSNFESDYCEELAFLRGLNEVGHAGPLIRSGKYAVITYDHKISLYQFGINYRSEYQKERSKEINQLVKQLDERYYFDEKTREIVLPPETNEIVPKIMEKLREIGIKNRMMMLVYQTSYVDY